MSYRFLGWSVIALIGCSFACVRPVARALRGRVVDAGTGAPVHSAVVCVIGTRQYTRTDEYGRFRFDSLPSEMPVIRTRRIGYAARLDSARRNRRQGDTLRVRVVPVRVVLDNVTVGGPSNPPAPARPLCQ